jgi:glycosyltransferase involved in cell wall biosynthesis
MNIISTSKTMNLLVSIIIPTFNRAHLIGETLDSILSQTYSNWECIIVDDGSTDTTEIIIRDYIQNDSRFHFYKRTFGTLKGPSSCRNIGLNAANGEFVMFLDSDDLLIEFCIEDRLKAFESNLDLDFIVFDMAIFSYDKPHIERKELIQRKTENWLANFMTIGGSWQVTAPLYRTSFMKRHCGFAEELSVFEDFEIAVNLIFHSNKYKVFANVDCLYRNEESYLLKHIDLNYNKKVVQAFVKLLVLFEEKIISKVDLKSEKEKLKHNSIVSYCTIFDRYIVRNIPFFKNENQEIIKFLYQNNYIANYQYFKFLIVQKVLFKFHKLKGLGVYRLISVLME